MTSRSRTSANPDERDALVDLAREGAAADGLDEREEDVAAVERQQRQEVEERERHAHEREDLEVVGQADLQLLLRDADDPDRSGELAAPLLEKSPRDSGRRAGHDAPEVRSGRSGGPAGRVRDGLRRRLEAEDPAAVLLDGRRAGRRPPAARRARTVSVTGPPRLDRIRCETASNVPHTPAVDGDDPVARAGDLPRLPACRPTTATTSALARDDGPPLMAKTRKRITNATRTFASGPAAMTATRFHVGCAPVRLGSGALLDLAERPLRRAPRARRQLGGARPRARARSPRAARPS